jgi:GNAT superfamily N-acetyltransferase
MNVTVRPVAQGDFFAWYGLFASYADFYDSPLTDDRAMRAWAWLNSDEYSVRGLVAVAEDSDDILGLAHIRPFERTLTGGMGLYLDDLFVREDARGQGVGKALIHAVTQQAGERGYNVVRWITAEDNETARKLYDSLAEKTSWVTYDVAIG